MSEVTGLQNNRYRWYDYQTGRFGGRDPIYYRSDINLYGYVWDCSASYRDPFGTHPYKVNYSSYCNASEIKSIDKSLDYVFKIFTEWLNIMGGQIGSSASKVASAQRRKRVVSKWFGDSSEETIKSVRKVINKTTSSAATKTLDIDCECFCMDESLAYVWAGAETIHICPKAFESNEWMLATTLFHEMTHMYAGTEDHGYVESNSVDTDDPKYNDGSDDGETFELTNEQKLENADTYTGVIDEKEFRLNVFNATRKPENKK